MKDICEYFKNRNSRRDHEHESTIMVCTLVYGDEETNRMFVEAQKQGKYINYKEPIPGILWEPDFEISDTHPAATEESEKSLAKQCISCILNRFSSFTAKR